MLAAIGPGADSESRPRNERGALRKGGCWIRNDAGGPKTNFWEERPSGMGCGLLGCLVAGPPVMVMDGSGPGLVGGNQRV